MGTPFQKWDKKSDARFIELSPQTRGNCKELPRLCIAHDLPVVCTTIGGSGELYQKNSFTADILTCSLATATPTRCILGIWSAASISRTFTGSTSGNPS